MIRQFKKKALTNVAIPLVIDNLPGLESTLTSNEINRFEIKMRRCKSSCESRKEFTLFIPNEDMNVWKRSCESRKEFTLFIPNKDMNDIIKTIKSLEDLGVLIDRVTKQ